jgi:hypothetical protein
MKKFDNKEQSIFYAGYARADITPTEYPIFMGQGTDALNAIEEIYGTCVAFSDGKTRALFVTVETQQVGESFYKQILNEVIKTTDLPQKNIFISSDHNHSAPHTDYERGNDILMRWRQTAAEKISVAAKQAFDDLSPATPYMAKTKTEGLSFVRRYRLEDGAYRGIGAIKPGASRANWAAHESDADPEVQIIRWAREDGKKDILMVHWQAHAAHAYSENTSVISGDFVYWLRKSLEEEHDVLVSYHQGGAANINLHSYVYNVVGEKYVFVGKKLAEVCSKAIPKLTPINTGKIKVVSIPVTVKIKPEPIERVEAALKVIRGEDKDGAIRREFDFEQHEPFPIYQRHMLMEENPSGYIDITVTAISFGDIAFVCAPYEMFDTNAKEVKDASPFKTTFVCAYTNGHYGYIPSALAIPHGQYEVYKCFFTEGTGEIFSNAMIDALKKAKE